MVAIHRGYIHVIAAWERGDRKGGKVSIYIHKSLDFTVKLDLSIIKNGIESFRQEKKHLN